MVRICVEHLSRHHRFEDELFNQLEPYFFDQECELGTHYVEFFCWPEHAEEFKPYDDILHKTEVFGRNVIFVTTDYAPQRTELMQETIECLNKHTENKEP